MLKNKYAWDNISFEINLVDAAKNQLNFLKRVDQLGNLYEGYYFERALYRYEFIWIPMVMHFENDSKIIPPIDVEWVKHVHMLSPTNYEEDMMNIANSVLDNHLKTEEEISKYLEYSIKTWKSFSKCAYDYTNDESKQNVCLSKIKYDLRSASSRQKSFYYQVSLPHFKSDLFLQKGLERYKKFLYLTKLNPKMFVVPCYLIDIIWHSHQLHPLEYKKDTEKILGHLLSHDDSVNDRSEGSKLISSGDLMNSKWFEVCFL
jgi:hypothetical protein